VADSFKDFEHAGWERATAAYPSTFGRLTSQLVEPLLDAARVRAALRVLDIATGPGYLAAAAAQRGAQVVGVDFSAAMIDQARAQHAGIEFRVGDAESLVEIGDGAFDAVVMGFGLLHLAHPEAAIAEAHRVLAAGGRYALSVWAPPTESVGFGILLDAMRVHGTLDVGLPEGPPFFRFSEHAVMTSALAASGFAEITVQTVPLTWRLTDPEQLFEAAMHGSVRTRALLAAQSPEALAAIRRVAHAAVAKFQDGDGYALPMPAVLAAATR
jgi:SAM-dependent methyltransferase